MTLFKNRVFADAIKVSSFWVQVGPKSNEWCLYKKSKWHTHGGDLQRRWPDEDRGRDCSYVTKSQEMPGAPKSCNKQRAFRGDTALVTPWFGNSSLRNNEQIHFHSLKPPNWRSFVMAALGNEYVALLGECRLPYLVAWNTTPGGRTSQEG